MNLLVPRLARDAALELLELQRIADIDAITASMPARTVTVTLSPLGGARVDHETLVRLRADVSIRFALRPSRSSTFWSSYQLSGRSLSVSASALPLR